MTHGQIVFCCMVGLITVISLGLEALAQWGRRLEERDKAKKEQERE